MTAQLPDQVVYNGDKHSLININGSQLPTPMDFNVYPDEWHTASIRGYIITYAIEQDHLVISQIRIGRMSPNKGTNEYPTINAIKPHAIYKWDFYIAFPFYGWRRWLSYLPIPKLTRILDSFVYDNLGLIVDFTGKLTLCKGFTLANNQCNHTIEMLFKQGKLIDVIDHSK